MKAKLIFALACASMLFACGNHGVALHWTASVLRYPSEILTYQVYRASSGGAFQLIAGGISGTTYLDQSVAIGGSPQTYQYEVKAFDAALAPGSQLSEPSNIFTVTVP